MYINQEAEFKIVLLLMFFSSQVMGQPLEQRHQALRDITATRLVIGTFPNRDPAVPCFLDAAVLERRAVETLRAAGLRTLTFAEAMAQSRRDGESLTRDLEAQRRGDRLNLDAPEIRRRAASIDFLRSLPALQILFSTTPITTSGGTTCALAASSNFRVFPAEDVVSGATGHRIRAGLLVWEGPLGAYTAPEAELTALALAQLDEMTSAFLEMWRRVNNR